MKTYNSRTYMRPGPTPKMPSGLKDLMEDLTKEVLRNNPADVYQFCTNHMHKLLEIRDGPLKSPRYLSLEEKIKIAQTKVNERILKRQQKENEKLKQFIGTEIVGDNNYEVINEGIVMEKIIESVNKIGNAYELDNNVSENIEHDYKLDNNEKNIQLNVTIPNENVSDQILNTTNTNLVMEDEKLRKENKYAEKVVTSIENVIKENIINKETHIGENKSERLYENYETKEITNNIESQILSVTVENIITDKAEDLDIIGTISNINGEIIKKQNPVKQHENTVDDVIEFVDKLSVEGNEQLFETAILLPYNLKIEENSDHVEFTNNTITSNAGEELKVEIADKDVELSASNLVSGANSAIKDLKTNQQSNSNDDYSTENITSEVILKKEVTSNDIFLQKLVGDASTNEDDLNKNMNGTLKKNPHNNQETLKVNMNEEYPDKESIVKKNKDETNINLNSTSLDNGTVKENLGNPKEEVVESEFSEFPDGESKDTTKKDDADKNMNSINKGTEEENSPHYLDQEILKINVKFSESKSNFSESSESNVNTNKADTDVNLDIASLDNEIVTKNLDNPKEEVFEADFTKSSDGECKDTTKKDDTNINMYNISVNKDTVEENSVNNPIHEIFKESKVNTSKVDTDLNLNSVLLDNEKVKKVPDYNLKQEFLEITVNADLSESLARENTIYNIVSLNRTEDSEEIISCTGTNDIASAHATAIYQKTDSSPVKGTESSIKEDTLSNVNINPLIKNGTELEPTDNIKIIYNDSNGDALNESEKYIHDQHTKNNEQLNDTYKNVDKVHPQITLNDVIQVEIEHQGSNIGTENTHRPTRDVSTEDDTDASIGSHIESIDNNGDTSEEIALNLDKSQAPMDLETAAVTIQKVFRTFLFKSRNSTIDEGSNDMPFLSNEENLLENEQKPSDSESLLTSNKERRALSRMDTVLQTVNEEKSLSLSTDDSSTLSSAATTIQAHVRGFLVRSKLNSHKTNSTSSLLTSGDPGTSSELENEVRSKTVLNIHIVPEGAQFESIDNMSVDLPLDASPRTSNLHPLGYDKSEPRKQLKREDAIQSVSPPSNNSGKLSEDRDSVKELPLNEAKNFPEIENTPVDDGKDTVDKYTEISEETTPTKSLTADTVIEVTKDLTEDSTSSEIKINIENKRNRLTKMSSDEMDVVTPYEDGSYEKLEDTKLIHSGEFHDAVLPTRVSRHEPSVVREFKIAFVYFLRWNN